ncbi:hypothetical protein GI364_06970 [Alicyclobacillus sp. SO9]|nr:hypothetical protein GI364_06970 [Alicyclobacillus sp. SO9]
MSNRENTVKFALRVGSRDDYAIGSAHTLEHILVKRVQAIVKNDATVTGYTTHDMLILSITIFASNSHNRRIVLSDALSTFLEIGNGVEESEFLTARQQITQELTFDATDIRKTLTHTSVQSLWSRNSLGRPIDDLSSKIQFPEFRLFVNNIRNIKFSIVASDTYYDDFIEILTVSPNEVPVEILVDNPCVYEPVDLHYTRKELGSLIIKAWGVGIPKITANDILTVGVVTGIWNTRLQKLKELGSYVTVCFPRIHRGEHSINIIYSGDASLIEKLDTVVSDIQREAVSSEEFEVMKSVFTGLQQSTAVDELKTIFWSDIFEQDITASIERIVSNIHTWMNELNNKKPGTIVWSSS